METTPLERSSNETSLKQTEQFGPDSEFETPRWPARYGLGALVAAIGTFSLAGGFAIAPIAIATSAANIDQAPVLLLATTAALGAVWILSAIGFASVCQPLKWSLFGLRRVGVRRALAWIGVGILIYVPLEVLFAIVINDTSGDKSEHLTWLGWIAVWIAYVVFPPISEEFIFRGFVFQAFRNRMGVVLAAFLSSALFGLGHIEDFSKLAGLAPGAAATVFGIAMCVVFQKTKSLYPGMTVHALHNSTVVVLAAMLS